MKTNGTPRVQSRPRATTLKLAASAAASAIVLLCVAALTAPAPTSAAPPDPIGTLTVRAGNYIGDTTTETFTLEKQVFTGSTDCTSGGGAVVTVNGIDGTNSASRSVGVNVPKSQKK